MGLKVITGPTAPLIPLEVCRQQCEVVPIDGNSDAETHPDDGLILGMLDAAVEAAEDFTGLCLSQKTLELALDKFPDAEIELPMPPLISIVSVTYVDDDTDSDGAFVVQAVNPTDYTVDDYQRPNWLLPAYGLTWPEVADVANAVKIQFIAGYALDSDGIAEGMPQSIRAAILLMLGHLYRNREETTEKAMSSIPSGFESLLRPRRILLGFA